jgi:type VI secretion system protein ImpF
MRAIVQRDLLWLLNTTSLEDEIDAALYPQVISSVVNYGVPPFAGTFIAQRNWAEIERIVRRVIETFEPRFLPQNLQITPLVDASSDQHYNVLSFEIRGLIHMQPYPMEFIVQSSFDLETRRLIFK